MAGGILNAIAGGVTGGAQAVGEMADKDLAMQRQLQLDQATSDMKVAAEKQISDYNNQMQLSNQAAARQRRAGYATDTAGNMGKTAANAIAAGEGDYGESILGAQSKAEKIVPYGGVALGPTGDVQYDNSLAKQQTEITKAQIQAGGRVSAAQSRSGNVAAVQKLLEGQNTSVWGQTGVGADGKTGFTPHPGANEAFHTLVEGYAASGAEPSSALMQGRRDIQGAAAAAQQDVTAAGFKPGTPEFEDARTQRLNQYVQARLSGPQPGAKPDQSAGPPAPAGQPNVGTAPPKPGILNQAAAEAAPADVPEATQKGRARAILTGSDDALHRALRTPGYSAQEQQAIKAELARRDAQRRSQTGPDTAEPTGAL